MSSNGILDAQINPAKFAQTVKNMVTIRNMTRNVVYQMIKMNFPSSAWMHMEMGGMEGTFKSMASSIVRISILDLCLRMSCKILDQVLI